MKFVTIEAANERAVLAPELGCQCLSYRVGTRELIAGPQSIDTLREHPFRSGIPILFPWPGRIAHGRFNFNGREFVLPINEVAHGHAIHGLTWSCAFELIERTPSRARIRLDSANDQGLSRVWPFPFILQLEYEVGDGLRISFRVRNSGNAEMPFGFGAHPYFNAPLDVGTARGAMMLQVPAASRRWPLDSALIPSGAPLPVADRFDLMRPRALADNTYDDVFQLEPSRDPAVPCARLLDPAMQLQIEVRAEAAFKDFVIYAPPDNPVVAMEPYTCAPDAFNLARRGIDAGMRILAPGENFETSFRIRLAGRDAR